jgi:CubicO group peptidase (beta-lactamase class C family)
MSLSLNPELTTHRLEATFPTICAIQELFQSPSFSIGVLHCGEVVLTKGFGFSNKATGRVPDEDTVYSIGSCTKAFTATALSLLEQRGKVNWEEPVSTYLPEFKTPYSPVVGEKATLPDILSHSTGLDNLPYAVG